MNILQNKFIISDKDSFNFKGTTPIYKQDICKYDKRFSIPSVVSKVHFSNKWGIPCKSLEWASKVLKHCSEFLITATVLTPMVSNNNCSSIENLKTLLSEYCSIEITIIPFVVFILGKQQTLSNMLPWILNSASRMQVQYSLFPFMTLSGGVRRTQARSGCVGSWEENLLTKQSPKKVTRYHLYNQNGCDTRPSERCSTL